MSWPSDQPDHVLDLRLPVVDREAGPRRERRTAARRDPLVKLSAFSGLRFGLPVWVRPWPSLVLVSGSSVVNRPSSCSWNSSLMFGARMLTRHRGAKAQVWRHRVGRAPALVSTGPETSYPSRGTRRSGSRLSRKRMPAARGTSVSMAASFTHRQPPDRERLMVARVPAAHPRRWHRDRPSHAPRDTPR